MLAIKRGNVISTQRRVVISNMHSVIVCPMADVNHTLINSRWTKEKKRAGPLAKGYVCFHRRSCFRCDEGEESREKKKETRRIADYSCSFIDLPSSRITSDVREFFCLFFLSFVFRLLCTSSVSLLVFRRARNRLLFPFFFSSSILVK